MYKISRNVSLGILFTIILASASALQAQPCMPDGGPGRKGPGGPRDGIFFGNPGAMKQDLGLTDAQITKIGEINLGFKKQMLDQREKLVPKEIRLERLLLEDTPDLGNVRKALREISDIKLEIQMIKVSHRLEIEKVLTQEQKTRLKGMRKHHRGGPEGRRPGGPGRKGAGGPGFY